MIFHALAALCRCDRIDAVWVVLSPGDEWWASFDWSPMGDKLRVLYRGGSTRAETVANGLAAIADEAGGGDWVLGHGPARPRAWLGNLTVTCVEIGGEPVGAALAVPVADTLKRADADQRVAATQPRDGMWQAQTPQMFRYGLLRKVLEGNSAVTDEAGAIEAAGLQPRLVRADSTNLKVTFPTDLLLAEYILKGRRT